MNSIQKKDKKYIWHPYTQHKFESNPIYIKNAKKASLYDYDGREILDLISSWWTTTHGHSHPTINKALSKQVRELDHVMFAGFTHSKAIELSESIVKILPKKLKKVFFSDNGSTAVEVAIKLCFQFWVNKGMKERKHFIAFDGAYHGDTLGAMSVGKGCGFFKLFKDILFSVETIPFPETWHGDNEIEKKELQSINVFKKVILKNRNKIAGIIIEPLIQGAGGIRFCRPNFIKQIVNIANENKILVIFDEVAVGFGRTGQMFACNKIKCEPDLLCLSKGLTAGYMPMAITVTSNELFNCFLSNSVDKALLHGHTFTANPLACAVAKSSLDLFESEKTLKKIESIEKNHLNFLKEILKHPKIMKPRVMGSIFGFNINKTQSIYKNKKGEFLKNFFLDAGFNIRPIGSTVYLMPPYCITKKELEKSYSVILSAIDIL